MTANTLFFSSIIFIIFFFFFLFIFLYIGMLNYCERYGETIYNVSKTLGAVTRFEGTAAENVNRQLCEKIPLEQLDERRAWRNMRLASLAKLKQQDSGSQNKY